MTISRQLHGRLRIPAVCAPMFFVSGPELVEAACLSGVIGAFPRHNARSLDEFESWLRRLDNAFKRQREISPDTIVGPLAVNIAAAQFSTEDLAANLDLCQRYGVDIIINAVGDPTDITAAAHDRGMLVYADAVNLRFADKAIGAGVDGINVVGAGGGGHSGTISPFALVPAVRAQFAGTICLGGAISTGRAIRAAEILGADLAYMGTRFIASQESRASFEYKEMIVRSGAADISYSSLGKGPPANWLIPSRDTTGTQSDAKPWRDIWSAGHGVEQIGDAPDVATLVAQLELEYRTACSLPAF